MRATNKNRVKSQPATEALQMQRELGLSKCEFGPLWKQAQGLLHNAALSRFFDPRQITEYRDAIRSIYPDRKVSGAIVFADAGVVYID